MKTRLLIGLATILSLGFTCDPKNARPPAEFPPGQVYALKRMWQGGATDDPYGGSAPFTATLYQGIDTGAPSGSHFSWYMVSTDEWVYDYRKLPPGLVFGLKHSRDPGTLTIKVRGVDPADPDDTPPAGLRRMHGGDLGLPSGSGYYWFESTGENFAGWANESDRKVFLDGLPRRFVVDLMHSVNTPGHSVTWPVWESTSAAFKDHTFCASKELFNDPMGVWPPFDLKRQEGGDYGASSGQGYFWYLYESAPGPAVSKCPNGKPGDPCDDKNPMTTGDAIGNDCACRGKPSPSVDLTKIAPDGGGCLVWNCVPGGKSGCIQRCELAGLQNASAFAIRIVLCGDANEAGDASCCGNKPSLILPLAPGATLSAEDYLVCKTGHESVTITVCSDNPGSKIVVRVFTQECNIP